MNQRLRWYKSRNIQREKENKENCYQNLKAVYGQSRIQTAQGTSWEGQLGNCFWKHHVQHWRSHFKYHFLWAQEQAILKRQKSCRWDNRFTCLLEQRSSRAQVERVSTSVRSDILPALYSQANLMTSCFRQEFVSFQKSQHVYTHITH